MFSINSIQSKKIKRDMLQSFKSLETSNFDKNQFEKKLDNKLDNKKNNGFEECEPSTEWACKYLELNSKINNYYKENNIEIPQPKYPYDYDK